MSVPLDRAIASATCIPHPRQEPVMTAPAPSPAEQAVIERSGIFEPEERWEQRIRAVARAMSDEDGLYRFTMAYWRRLAAAALTADAPLTGQHTTDEEADRG